MVQEQVTPSVTVTFLACARTLPAQVIEGSPFLLLLLLLDPTRLRPHVKKEPLNQIVAKSVENVRRTDKTCRVILYFAPLSISP